MGGCGSFLLPARPRCLNLHPMRCLPFLALALLGGTIGLRAQSPSPVTPAVASRPAPVSPEILEDGRVTFRLRAPQAQAVSVSGQFQKGRVPLVRDVAGDWSVTVGPIPADIYEYRFTVDGLDMIDPANRAIKPMRSPRTSILAIAGKPPRLHDWQDVPHGKVSLHTYRSRSLNRLRGLQVYTPPGYDAAPAGRFPVLYLFHGSGDNEATWVAHGQAHWILDNLIAGGRAVPMIVVMLDGHAVIPGENTAGARQGNVAAFERDLLEDAMPFVAANYRTREEAGSRGIIGLSMGGGQSLNIGLRHSDRFAWVGGMSSSIRELPQALEQGDRLNAQLKLLWLACGRDDFLVQPNRDFAAALQDRKIRHTYTETDGDHSWPVWRRYLGEFLPIVFR